MSHRLALALILFLTTACADHQMRANQRRAESPVAIGMPAAEVQARWGRPERVSRLTTAQGVREVWYYPSGTDVAAVSRRSLVLTGRYVSVQFQNGLVALGE